jgi:hypothetical protein
MILNVQNRSVNLFFLIRKEGWEKQEKDLRMVVNDTLDLRKS